jgi:aminomethyltransferase
MQSLRGPTATAFLEWITPSSLSHLSPYSSTLSVILNEKGGIIDDTVITKHAEDAYYVVTNAGRRHRDLAWFEDKLREWNASDKGKQGPVKLEVLDNWGLLALQGHLTPKSCRNLCQRELQVQHQQNTYSASPPST